MTGLILKGVGGFYTLLSDGTRYVCKARGRFRKDGIKPLPGDTADFSYAGGEGYLLSIHERKNCLTRPAVANIDQLLVTIALTLPPPDFLLVDRLLLQARKNAMEAILIVNKCDEAYREDYAEVAASIKAYEAAGITVLSCSAVSLEGLSALRPRLTGKTSALAGQSAVGKSSLLNALFPALGLSTGGLSEKTQRGRHTTRHAELLPLSEGGCVVDTPGFSLLETDAIEPQELSALYPEFQHAGQCRFPGCLHESEPDCAVKTALRPESAPRYERYLTILNELKESRRHRFD